MIKNTKVVINLSSEMILRYYVLEILQKYIDFM